MAELIQNIRQAWARTALVQRVVLVGILALCLGAVALLVNWARRPSLGLLYSQVAPEEAAKIVERITEQGLPYELRNGGTAIYVPQDQVYSLRLSLAGEGLPAGEQGGYRILDDEKIGASPFSQQVNYLRAIEGELAKTIQLIDGVSAARVKIVRPQNSLFADQQGQASASVMLQLRPGRRLGAGAVAAIVHLLAGGVEGLSSEKVVVVDSRGNLLSGESEDTLARKAGTFLDYKSQVEQYLAAKAEDMLAAALGPGRASVRVDATIETASSEQTVETYDPKPVVAREDIVSKSAATVTAAGEGQESPGNNEKESTTTTEYVTGKTTRRLMEMPGKVSGLSVAALVDLSAAPQQGAKLTLQDAEQIIRGAIGLGEDSRLTVKEAAFYQPPAPEALPQEGWLTKDFLLDIAQRVSLGVLVIGALLALKMMGGARGKTAAEAAALTAAGAGAPALASNGSAGRMLPAGLDGSDPERLRAHISQALQENPEEVRRLFMSWAKSEKEGS